MDGTGMTSGLRELLDAVSEDLRSLAALHDEEPSRDLLRSLADLSFPDSLGLELTSTGAMAARELFGAFFSGIEGKVNQELLDTLAVDYADIYMTFNLRAAPSESPWTNEDGLERQESMFAVREFYRRCGLTVPDWERRADDHIVHQLQFLAHLMDTGTPEALEEAVRFLDQHPLRWIGPFTQRVVQGCRTQFFAATAILTATYLGELRHLLGKLTNTPEDGDPNLPF